MKEKIRKTIIMTLIITFIIGLLINKSIAYFTTIATAEGGFTITVGEDMVLDYEEMSDWTLHNIVRNSDESDDVWVRVKIFKPDRIKLQIHDRSDTGLWTEKSDGYIYYTDIVGGGMNTEMLDIQVIADSIEEGNEENFNIVVVAEATPVYANEAGELVADWSRKIK